MQDPVADMLTRIRNGQQSKHSHVKMPSSKLKQAIALVLKEEGFIADFEVSNKENGMSELMVSLKYYQDMPVIDKLKRISRPGLRVYLSAKQIKPIPGFGIAILSTSQGVMSHAKAKHLNVGGEVICEVA